MSKADNATLDRVVADALREGPASFGELETRVRALGASPTTALQIRQSAWRLIGARSADLRPDMKVAKVGD